MWGNQLYPCVAHTVYTEDFYGTCVMNPILTFATKTMHFVTVFPLRLRWNEWPLFLVI